ncbi:MAG TPA: hypothetical protein VFS43_27915 [Polyangiaceae bacterium]|nr:hypothetical protein [Polyangiaceae bacterium]
MLHLPDVRAALVRELHEPRNAPVFEAGRRRRPRLAEYASPDLVVTLLWDNDDAALADELTCALLAEQQARPAPLWCAMLTLAFFPMLGTLAGVLKRGRPGGDVDELVLYAFLDAVYELPAAELPGRALRRLRQRTRRAAFRRTREALDERRREPLTLSDEAPDPLLEAAGVARWRREEADRALRALVAGTPPRHRAGLDVLFATALEGESIARYAARLHPAATGDERERLTSSLKRRRSRALARLREGLLPAE